MVSVTGAMFVDVRRINKKIVVYSFTKSLKNIISVKSDENFTHNTPPILVVKRMIERRQRDKQHKSRRSGM